LQDIVRATQLGDCFDARELGFVKCGRRRYVGGRGRMEDRDDFSALASGPPPGE